MLLGAHVVPCRSRPTYVRLLVRAQHHEVRGHERQLQERAEQLAVVQQVQSVAAAGGRSRQRACGGSVSGRH